MKSSFGACHALKSPAHITLQMPFRRDEKDETIIIQELEKFSAQQNTFDVFLNGFDCFAPRVIFIRVKNHQPLVDLHNKLNEVLSSKLDFKSKVLTQKLHPHMTIATRDLSEDAFEQAWAHYKAKEFTASFEVSSLFLLKHNGQYWDLYKEFHFTD